MSDEYMKDMLARTQAHSVVLLRRGPRYAEPGARAIIAALAASLKVRGPRRAGTDGGASQGMSW